MTRETLFSHKEDSWVLLLPEGHEHLTGIAGYIDWYTNHLLSKWMKAQKIKLEADETVLVSPGTLLPSKQLLIVTVKKGTQAASFWKKLSKTLEGLGQEGPWIIASDGISTSLTAEFEYVKSDLPNLKKATLTVEAP